MASCPTFFADETELRSCFPADRIVRFAGLVSVEGGGKEEVNHIEDHCKEGQDFIQIREARSGGIPPDDAHAGAL